MTAQEEPLTVWRKLYPTLDGELCEMEIERAVDTLIVDGRCLDFLTRSGKSGNVRLPRERRSKSNVETARAASMDPSSTDIGLEHRSRRSMVQPQLMRRRR